MIVWLEDKENILNLALEHKQLIFPILMSTSFPLRLYPSADVQHSRFCVVFSKVRYGSDSLESCATFWKLYNRIQKAVSVVDSETVVGHAGRKEGTCMEKDSLVFRGYQSVFIEMPITETWKLEALKQWCG